MKFGGAAVFWPRNAGAHPTPGLKNAIYFAVCANQISTVHSFKPDAVFHLAGQVAMNTSIANPRMDFEIDVKFTDNLLEAVRPHC